MTQSRAVAKPAPTNDEITAILRQMGAVEPAQETNRVKIDGSTYMFGDEPFVSNPRTGAPAFTARIVDAPVQYQALWIDDAASLTLERPNMAGRFCKSHFDNPQEGRQFAEDGTSCHTCPANPFTKNSPLENGRKCQWKGDLSVQLVDPDTGLLRDDKIWLITLPTTGMIEWQGSNRDPQGGNVSEANFMHKLARMGAEADNDDPVRGIQTAVNALGLGLVIAEGRILRGQSDDKSRTWSVPSFTPTLILEYEDEPEKPAQISAPVLTTEPENDPLASDADLSDLPF